MAGVDMATDSGTREARKSTPSRDQCKILKRRFQRMKNGMSHQCCDAVEK